ncbi:hypothetical protein MMC24_001376 [Lignoscripta atroalba]|nr:hypothetical protein [Lignoscripta atroalba]
MGCGPSRPSRPTAVRLTDLAPNRPGRPATPEPDLTTEALNMALQYMAQYISKRRENITVVGIGGAVNVMLLHTRLSTHDVDFFNQHLTQSQTTTLREAASFARQQMGKFQRIRMPDDWFNNRTIVFIPAEVRMELTDEAIQQRDVVFRANGLTVVSAPWPYAFCAKLNRISGGGSMAYDARDAASYLHRYLSRNRDGRTSVSVATIRHWGSQYRTRTGDAEIRAVDDVYASMYGRSAIDWRSRSR